jgi:hypothetical protein
MRQKVAEPRATAAIIRLPVNHKKPGAIPKSLRHGVNPISRKGRASNLTPLTTITAKPVSGAVQNTQGILVNIPLGAAKNRQVTGSSDIRMSVTEKHLIA